MEDADTLGAGLETAHVDLGQADRRGFTQVAAPDDLGPGHEHVGGPETVDGEGDILRGRIPREVGQSGFQGVDVVRLSLMAEIGQGDEFILVRLLLFDPFDGLHQAAAGPGQSEGGLAHVGVLVGIGDAGRQIAGVGGLVFHLVQLDFRAGGVDDEVGLVPCADLVARQIEEGDLQTVIPVVVEGDLGLP